MNIKLFDTQAQVRSIRADLERAMLEVIDSGRFILGPEVQAFESEFAAYLGADHVVGVANGTDALTIALLALGVGPGDEVVVPSFTFYASAEAIPHTGAVPVFCDIDPDTFCLSAQTVERVLTPATRAIVGVHLFGNVAPVHELRELVAGRDIVIVEDAAQAVGAQLDGRRAGTLGDAATFSFFPSKNLFCLGDGGAIATNDATVADRVRLLRHHGSRDKHTFTLVGFNSRLDEIQAAVLRAVLPKLDDLNARRRALAAAYAGAGVAEHFAPQRGPDRAEPAYHLYVGRVEAPDDCSRRLDALGIEARSYYRVPVHRQPGMARYGEGLELPGTEEAAATSLALPMGPTYGAETARAVVDALRA
jgi:dTDP-4-amino-4,6-dideoxygalactose transaminase